MKKITLLLTSLLIFSHIVIDAAHQPEFSTAGFFSIKESGRNVYNMNPAWRIHKGDVQGAEDTGYDDRKWKVTSLPDGIELLPMETSGCINYQGIVWYRKHFEPSAEMKGKKLFLHFEAIMGKSKVYVNGKLLKEFFGGFLPVIVDVSQALEWGQDNVIAVCADNSDDPLYPPGKFQDVLDFTYAGGIYRDCWLVAHNDVYITDPNYENIVAGGGLFVSFNNVSKKSANVSLDLHLRNDSKKLFGGKVEFELQTPDGNIVKQIAKNVNIGDDEDHKLKDQIVVANPSLWTPDSPYLYNLIVRIKDKSGKIIDGYRQRVGIRSIEFRGEDGFWLNGEPYPHPLIGGNRHQDYAIVGNALSNSTHWRDAKKMRDVGMKVVRNAHYPQDPAFMDACDELGLFVIVNTPGWQFWNPEPIFEERVYSDIRQMVRRDRNRASVWLWEPILNETYYPEHFAKRTKDIVEKEEYPYPYCYTASDHEAKGSEYFSVQFTHPTNSDTQWALKDTDVTKTYFTREWGDNVDDWTAQNSLSRVALNWGEQPMLMQAQHYAHPSYPYTSYEALHRTSRQHVGGSLWHTFDHQRGYHPDPFYGGIMDIYRQPKTSYYMFKAQRDPKAIHPLAETGAMVYVAHDMNPFSDKDVVVYSNCDEVRLTYNTGGETLIYRRESSEDKMPYPIITFEGVYDFMKNKALSRAGKQKDVFLLAEGYIDGKLVASHKVTPTLRPENIRLRADNEGLDLVADGSDFVTIVAEVTDAEGNVKRLNNYSIHFQIEGEGRLLASSGTMTNPMPIRWGSAPVIVQATTKAGKITVKGSVFLDGKHMPLSGQIEINTKSPIHQPLIYNVDEIKDIDKIGYSSTRNITAVDKGNKEENAARLKEVENQQDAFGETR